jgi:hypothetical protein
MSYKSKPAFATNDLVKQHSSDRTLWTIWGRSDDQIVLSTGEKTNPAPIESLFLQHPHILNAVMFGHGQICNGIILLLKKNMQVGDQNGEDFQKGLQHILTSVNNVVPFHSRILPEMIIIADSARPFATTGKGSIRRDEVLKLYAEDIKSCYTALFGSNMRPASESEHSSWVYRILETVIGHSIIGDLDLFEQGCDSFAATRIQYILQQAHLFGSRIPRNFVYSYPTADQMSDYLFKLNLTQLATATDQGSEQQMLNMVSQYAPCHSCPKDSTDTNKLGTDTVLLTGSTGSLGCHLLELLFYSPSISRIYALIRPHPTHSILKSQSDALKKINKSPDILADQKIVLLEGISSASRFGLSTEQFNKILQDVTLVIHAGLVIYTLYFICLTNFGPFSLDSQLQVYLVFFS